MKVLSVRQPWPWAIFHAGKDIENRDWSTNFRGTVAIHAAKGMTRDEYDSFYFMIRENSELWKAAQGLPSFERLTRGAILGTVEIVDCVKTSDSPWFFGAFGFVLRNPRLLVEPIEWRGALGYWDVPTDIIMGYTIPRRC